ncbi:MAG: hypothetical protein CM15mP45_17350 [Deltaproteobacteria bacterium]|nr:MAG: hypothetical protein CM15mP45_17350 [Deltaproteobacteria bacterium]
MKIMVMLFILTLDIKTLALKKLDFIFIEHIRACIYNISCIYILFL